MYSTAADLEMIFGKDNIKRWSVADASLSTTDYARVAYFQSLANAHINDRLRGGPYAIPLAYPASEMHPAKWEATLAGIMLYESRSTADEGSRYDDMKQATLREIDMAKCFAIRLDAAVARVPMPTGAVVV